MIGYNKFFKLKLTDFLDNHEEIESVSGWEFMDDIWKGETIGFTEFLQLESDDEKTRSISLDLTDLPNSTIDKIITSLDIALQKGMTKKDVIKSFGQPQNTLNFIEDRTTLEYIIGESEKYFLSLTITNDDGLIFITMMNHDLSIQNHE